MRYVATITVGKKHIYLHECQADSLGEAVNFFESLLPAAEKVVLSNDTALIHTKYNTIHIYRQDRK